MGAKSPMHILHMQKGQLGLCTSCNLKPANNSRQLAGSAKQAPREPKNNGQEILELKEMFLTVTLCADYL